jgi:hypothetical protein
VHLRQLQLRLCAHAGGERYIADDVAEGLSVARNCQLSPGFIHRTVFRSIAARRKGYWVLFVPLGLVLGEDLALGVVADDLDVDEAAEVELLGAEHGHDCGGGGW